MILFWYHREVSSSSLSTTVLQLCSAKNSSFMVSVRDQRSLGDLVRARIYLLRILDSRFPDLDGYMDTLRVA